MNAAIHDGITDPTYGPRDKILYPIYEDSLGGEEWRDSLQDEAV